MSESFVYECALRVLFKGDGEVGRGDDSCGEVQRRGGGEHAAETNAQAIDGLLSMCMMTRITCFCFVVVFISTCLVINCNTKV